MDEMTVTTREELRAAVLAAGCNTYDEARKNPVKITLGTCTYNFPAGLHTSRAQQIARAIRKVAAKHFDVREKSNG